MRKTYQNMRCRNSKLFWMGRTYELKISVALYVWNFDDILNFICWIWSICSVLPFASDIDFLYCVNLWCHWTLWDNNHVNSLMHCGSAPNQMFVPVNQSYKLSNATNFWLLMSTLCGCCMWLCGLVCIYTFFYMPLVRIPHPPLAKMVIVCMTSLPCCMNIFHMKLVIILNILLDCRFGTFMSISVDEEPFQDHFLHISRWCYILKWTCASEKELTWQWERVNFLVILIKLFAYFGLINVLRSIIFLYENMGLQRISVNPCKRLHCNLNPIKSSLDIESSKADPCQSCRCWFGPNFVWVRGVKFRVAGYFLENADFSECVHQIQTAKLSP